MLELLVVTFQEPFVLRHTSPPLKSHQGLRCSRNSPTPPMPTVGVTDAGRRVLVRRSRGCGGMVLFKRIPDPQAVLVNRLGTAGFAGTGTTARLDILRVNSTPNST